MEKIVVEQIYWNNSEIAEDLPKDSGEDGGSSRRYGDRGLDERDFARDGRGRGREREIDRDYRDYERDRDSDRYGTREKGYGRDREREEDGENGGREDPKKKKEKGPDPEIAEANRRRAWLGLKPLRV